MKFLFVTVTLKKDMYPFKKGERIKVTQSQYMEMKIGGYV